MESVENLEQTETGPRHVIQGTYQGTRIEVIAGYSIHADVWLFHVYVHHSQGHADRLTELPTSHRAKSLQEAFDDGLKLALSHLRSRQLHLPVNVDPGRIACGRSNRRTHLRTWGCNP